MIDWNKYQQAYLAASASVKTLIDSTTIPECVRAGIIKGAIDPKHQRIMVQLFSSHRLGLLSTDELLAEFRSLSIVPELLLYESINTCITSTTTFTDSLNITEKETAAFFATTNKTETQPAKQNIAADIAEAEAALAYTAPPATTTEAKYNLQSQDDQETTYRSTQNTNPAPATPPPIPRWGSDT